MHDTKFSMLSQYIARGWALVPLHDVAGGRCSCNRDCGGSAGKHPRYARWQEVSQLVRDERTLASLLHAPGGERWNWGVATGPVSGIWAMDVDPTSGGEAAFTALQLELLSIGETLPETLTLGPTGGGGRHLIYAWPTDGSVIHGSQTKNRAGLLPGLDVRGAGGQIVVAPSVSGKGAYGGTLIDLPVAAAGPVLLGRLSGRGNGGGALADAAVSADQRVPVSLPSMGVATDGITAARYRAYADAAVASLLHELRSAPVGTRNDTAFRVACRLIELINAPWAGLDPHGACDAWWEAGDRHPHAVRVPVAELDGVWQRAVARVGEEQAVPPGDDGWHGVGGTVIPFSSISPVVASVNGGGDARGIATDGSQIDAFSDPRSSGDAVSDGVGQFRTASADPVQVLIDRMLTPEQLREMAPPEPLVNGVLDLDTCAGLIGAPGSYKSFVALDLAAHVGRGDAWRGHAVQQGLVVYVAAEGARGMRLRVDAWEREYGPVKDVRVLPMPVQADERAALRAGAAGEWSVLVEACRRLRPVLIVIDTQARVTVGLNENDNTEMSYFAHQADRLKQASGACVLVVHHTGRSGTNARGASAIDGAQDAELRLERQGQLRVQLHMDKQKDQAEEPPTAILLRRSEAPGGGLDPRTGRDLSSLVLVHEGADDPFSDPGMPVNTGQMRAIALFRLIEQFGNPGEGLTREEARKLFMDLPEIAKLNPASRGKAFLRAWNGDRDFDGLIARGLIAKRAGVQRFKVIVIPNQSDEGVLTRNPTDGTGTPPASGWNMYLPDDDR